MYKLNDNATCIEDLKIPSLTKDLQSKTLMKLIGMYRERKVPIDVIALYLDLEQRPFSLYKIIHKMMTFS